MKLPKLSRRQWVFAAIAWLIFTGGVFGLFLLGALTESADGGDVGFWIGITVSFFGPPLLVGVVSLVMFGVRRRIKNAFGIAGCGLGIMFAAIMCIAIKPAGMLHGARTIVYGSASGTPTEIAQTQAAWVDIKPAFIDQSRIGRASHTTTDSKGKSSSRSRAVAPIVTAHGEADPAAIASERVALFVCLSRKDDLVETGRGNGLISGRMHRADFLELEAMADAKVASRDEAPRCVVPGRGASTFWIALWILIILAGGTGGSALVVAVASPRKA